MGSFLDRLREKNKNAKHVGVPHVTNQKVQTKVEKDAASFAARQKPMPNFTFGTGTHLEKLKARMANTPHPTPTCPDPPFNNGNSASKVDLDAFDAQFNAFMAKMKAAKAKKKQEAEKARLEKDEPLSKT